MTHYPARLGHVELGVEVERMPPVLPGGSVVAVGRVRMSEAVVGSSLLVGVSDLGR